jgi:hypothetical protein
VVEMARESEDVLHGKTSVLKKAVCVDFCFALSDTGTRLFRAEYPGVTA